MAISLKGKPVAQGIKDEVALFAAEHPLTMAIIQIGEEESGTAYRNFKKKQADSLGIQVREFLFPVDAKESDILATIHTLNEDTSITGIFIEQPFPQGISPEIVQHIHPDKDIDGITRANAGKLYLNEPGIFPATAEAIIATCEHYGVELQGKRVAIVGRSNVVGKPVAMMVMHRHGTITVCHSRTKDLAQVTKEADIVIAAIGKANMITGDYIREGAVVLDAGYNVEGDASFGDVEFATAEPKASMITPVPGGIGTVTNAVVFRNLVKAYRLQHGT